MGYVLKPGTGHAYFLQRHLDDYDLLVRRATKPNARAWEGAPKPRGD